MQPIILFQMIPNHPGHLKFPIFNVEPHMTPRVEYDSISVAESPQGSLAAQEREGRREKK
jgi:hypothetical protein